jgi:hypothetical protein
VPVRPQSDGGDIISEQGSAIFSERGGDFVGIYNQMAATGTFQSGSLRGAIGDNSRAGLADSVGGGPKAGRKNETDCLCKSHCRASPAAKPERLGQAFELDAIQIVSADFRILW